MLPADAAFPLLLMDALPSRLVTMCRTSVAHEVIQKVKSTHLPLCLHAVSEKHPPSMYLSIPGYLNGQPIDTIADSLS